MQLCPLKLYTRHSEVTPLTIPTDGALPRANLARFAFTPAAGKATRWTKRSRLGILVDKDNVINYQLVIS